MHVYEVVRKDTKTDEVVEFWGPFLHSQKAISVKNRILLEDNSEDLIFVKSVYVDESEE